MLKNVLDDTDKALEQLLILRDTGKMQNLNGIQVAAVVFVIQDAVVNMIGDCSNFHWNAVKINRCQLPGVKNTGICFSDLDHPA